MSNFIGDTTKYTVG